MTGHLYNLEIYLCVILLILLPASVTAQNSVTGRIIDSVRCRNHADHIYSLYLPSGYTERTKWPAILIFDPGGRGSTAVEVFRKASEKYGYILACSYNSRNGPMNNNFTAAEYLINDLISHYNIDNKRIYAAGFSGGSRFALALASSGNLIAGVIGCGAGLPNDKNLLPTAWSSFVYYGIAGNRDMNWLEMFDLITFFDTRTRVIPYLRTFNGGHQWPDPEIALEAVEWINLQAMKNKLIAMDSGYISFCSSKTRALINNLKTAGNSFDAARYMQFAIRDFSGSRVAREMAGSLTSLENSKDYRESKREWSAIASTERSIDEKYLSSIMQITVEGSVTDSAASWWEREIGSLVNMKERANKRKSEMASRVLNFISILCSEQGTAYYRQRRFDLSGFLFKVCTWSDGENMNNYYNLARSLSGANKKRDAIEALGKAFEHGFVSRKSVEMESVFDNIRNEGKFKSLLIKMK